VASQLGENTSEVEAEISDDTQVTLNSRYLIEALGCIDDKTVVFHCSGKLAACVLTPSGDKPDYQHIIMPLKS
jgi:DNA polymerase III sliding clamp (beta) subunit (PCNA family)